MPVQAMNPLDVFAEWAGAEEERLAARDSGDVVRMRAALERYEAAVEAVGMFGQAVFLLALEHGGTRLGRRLSGTFGQLGVSAWDRATRAKAAAEWAAAKIDALEARLRELEKRIDNRTPGVGEPGR